MSWRESVEKRFRKDREADALVGAWRGAGDWGEVNAQSITLRRIQVGYPESFPFHVRVVVFGEGACSRKPFTRSANTVVNSDNALRGTWDGHLEWMADPTLC